jgi:enoyl-[acyl-carrier protein] reductase I
MAAENYGYMAPVKAALDSTIVFLAKSFSAASEVRFNAVSPSLLKTSASAGIPGYVDAYLFAEQATLRKRALETTEVANVAAFLLSPRSAGINTQACRSTTSTAASWSGSPPRLSNVSQSAVAGRASEFTPHAADR